jgi:formyl-CoA transferase
VTGEKRAEHGAQLFAEITPWTLERDKYEVMHILGEASVPCSAVLDTHDLYRDPHLLDRDFVKHVEHPELGEVPLLGFPTRMSESSVEITRAPYLGEHSDEVLNQDLDIKAEELVALRAAGVLG